MTKPRYTVRYPTGVRPPVRFMSHKMSSSQLKTVNHHRVPRHKGFNKYHAKGIDIYHHHFDSHAEGAFYLLLRRHGANFSDHVTYVYRPRIVYKSRITGKTYALPERRYTPDFVEYKPGKKHIMKNIIRVVDVKGKAHITQAAGLRIDGFIARFHIPVVIARLDEHRGAFIEYVKGCKKHTWSVPLL